MAKFGILPERGNEGGESRAPGEFENSGRSELQVAVVDCVEYRSKIDNVLGREVGKRYNRSSGIERDLLLHP